MVNVGRKQTSNNEAWIELWNKCTDMVSVEHVLALGKKTIHNAIEVASRYNKIAYGYSGGKDSIVLASLLRKSGIKNLEPFCALHHCEYPEFEKWLFNNHPEGTAFIQLNRLSLNELNDHPEFLFPVGKTERAYYTGQWREAQNQYAIANDIDLVFAGRRLIDGNMCGRKDADGIYFSSNKLPKGRVLTTCNLIADWSHEELLAYIKYNGLELPPIYSYPNGWVFGTHPWTERDRVNNSIFDTFDEIMEIDPRIIVDASNTLEIAKKYIDGVRW